MDEETNEPSAVDQVTELNKYDSQETSEPESPADPGNKKDKKLIITLIAMAITVPILAFGAMNSQTLISKAGRKKCAIVWKVVIHPGEIKTAIGAPVTNLSVLAFDAKDNPIAQGVNYDWGLSSDNSIGTVKSRNDLAEFIPLNNGMGDLYVEVRNACTKKAKIGSVKVTVGDAPESTPTKRTGKPPKEK